MERMIQKKARIREYIDILESFGPDCKKKMRNPVLRGSILYYLYMMADSCIVLAEMIIKEKELRPPQSYADCIEILGENGILDKEFSYSFASIAGFRNFLAHDYEKTNYDQICDSLHHYIEDVKRFLDQIEQR